MDASRKAKHMLTSRAFFITLVLLLLTLLSACSSPVSLIASLPQGEDASLFPSFERADPSLGPRGDPAARYCRQVGGTVAIRTRGDGRAYGLCQFTDNRACEVWALFRGHCPVGGVRITGFNTIAQAYCAWLGGETLAVPHATCTLPNGKICDDDALYHGTCDDLVNQHMPEGTSTHVLSVPRSTVSAPFDFGNQTFALDHEVLHFTNGFSKSPDGQHVARIIDRSVNRLLTRAAAIVIDSPVGSGVFFSVIGAARTDGKESYGAPVFLGDRIKIETVSVGEETVTVHYLDHPAHAPLGTPPTQPVTLTYTIQDDGHLQMATLQVSPSLRPGKGMGLKRSYEAQKAENTSLVQSLWRSP